LDTLPGWISCCLPFALGRAVGLGGYITLWLDQLLHTFALGRPVVLVVHIIMWLDQLLSTFCSGTGLVGHTYTWQHQLFFTLLLREKQLVWLDTPRPGCICCFYLLLREDLLVKLDIPTPGYTSCFLPAAPGRPAVLVGRTYNLHLSALAVFYLLLWEDQPAGLVGHTTMVLDQLSPT
jgi:hypothetical protein